ncbi:hypothetical protein [Photobacterium leiognathi]|uniref:hypothetical protein n=1 Tax=Photobacterium leiognathi TaxID=553611 RepID=UPI002981DADD|nr:hypothetical protein [Photobacterium leiognathi]
MRYYSVRYKIKISKLIRHVGKSSLTLYIELSKAVADMQRSERLEKKYGKVLDWENYRSRLRGRFISVPFKTPCGKEIPSCVSIINVQSIENAEKNFFTPCPLEIKKQLLEKLERKKNNK